jgi:hypothetical protein
MTRLAKLQIVGPAILVAMIVIEELAAYFLAWKPSSEFAWYLNLQVFGVFQRGHVVLNQNYNIAYFQLLFVAAPIMVLIMGGHFLHNRLAISLASNLSFAYGFFLIYAWFNAPAPSSQAASLFDAPLGTALHLSPFNLTFGPHLCVLAVLLIPSLISSTTSHLVYLRAVRGS